MAVVVRQPLHEDEPIRANGFFPDLSLEDFQKSQSINATVPIETLRDVLQAAVARIQRQRVVKQWQGDQVKAGYLTLAEVPTDDLGDVLVLNYKLAVYYRAKGVLLKHFAHYMLTEKGNTEFEKRSDQASWYFNQSSRELRALIGLTATRVSTL